MIDAQDFTDALQTAFMLAVAFGLGTLIGAERQYRQRTAGLRTNALVAVGSAAFVDLGQRLGGDVESIRVIAYVVSGIGFLGAGVIMKEGLNVRGLNTAATLWCSAAIGSIAGSDMLAEAALLTGFVLLINTLLRPLVDAINRIPMAGRSLEATYSVTVTTEASRAGPMGDLLTVVASAALGAGLLEWGAPTVRTALEAMTSADLLIVATPTYKAAYTGLLKLLLDQLGQGELGGAPTVPVQLAAAPAHAMAVDVHLRPVLLEVGASCPTQSLFVLDATVDRLSEYLQRWATVNLPIVLASIAARMKSAP